MAKEEPCDQHAPLSAWNVATLKEYLDGRVTDQSKLFDLSAHNAKEAVDKALISSDKRLDTMNEFREQLKDQAATFLSRNEYLAQHQLLQQQVQNLNDRLNVSEGKSTGYNNTWVYVTGGVVAICAILALLLNAIRLFPGH